MGAIGWFWGEKPETGPASPGRDPQFKKISREILLFVAPGHVYLRHCLDGCVTLPGNAKPNTLHVRLRNGSKYVGRYTGW